MNQGFRSTDLMVLNRLQIQLLTPKLTFHDFRRIGATFIEGVSLHQIMQMELGDLMTF